MWEFTPSGTTPRTSARSPATLETMLVSGETVVTRFSFAGSSATIAPPEPHAAASNASATAADTVPGFALPTICTLSQATRDKGSVDSRQWW